MHLNLLRQLHHKGILAAFLVAIPLLAMPCSVPVFRYGLEHWAPDPGRVRIFHQSPLQGDAAAALMELQQAVELEPERANLTLELVDISSSRDADLTMDEYRSLGSPNEPWMSIRLPVSKHESGAVWSGPLNVENVHRVLDSPARQEIVSRLSLGESAVWILLESGDREADDAAALRLEKRLEYLMEVMELPKLDDEDIRNGLVSVPEDGLRLAFSVLRLGRDDPEEELFVRQLLATELDLADQSEPIAFPVFGQGRVLYALLGDGIKSENVDRAAAFLIGSCSCEVKEKNPGVDLIMMADWKGVVEAGGALPAALPTAAEILAALPETKTFEPSTPTQSNESSPPKGNRFAILAGILAAGLLALVVLKRPKVPAQK